MKNMLIVLLMITALSLTGCAKWRNEIAADGGLIGSYSGDYIVRNDSGGKIMDMWVLHNVMVQSDQHGSGWLFQDQNGNVIHLGGDVKVTRLNHGDSIKWHEYHAEFEALSYQEMYAK